MAMMRSAVFIDKDGTLVHNEPFNVDPSRTVLAPGAAASLRRLARLGYRLIVVSNQTGLALGYFSERALRQYWTYLESMLSLQRVMLDDFYYCPHHPEGAVAEWTRACTCRKPAPGLLVRAAGEHAIDLSSSWMVGDILDDVEAGRRAGCHAALADVRNETEWQLSPWRMPDIVAPSFAEAAALIPPPGMPLPHLLARAER